MILYDKEDDFNKLSKLLAYSQFYVLSDTSLNITNYDDSHYNITDLYISKKICLTPINLNLP